MGAILSGARKYHLGLILAPQDLAQLTKNDSELASSVLANAGTGICFRLSDTDAKRLSEGFSHFESTDLQNLSVGEAIARIGRPDNDFNLETIAFNTQATNEHYQTVIDASRQQYASTRKEVEELLFKSYEGIVIETPEAKQYSPKEKIKVTDPIEIKQVVEEIKVDSGKQYRAKREEQTQHRYLQTLIKRMAEQRGYKALIEEELKDKSGRVDVHIEGYGKKIACEVTVTTTDNWEIHNIEKNLAAGYDFVFECSTDEKTIDRLQKKITKELHSQLSKIRTGNPESLFAFLDDHVIHEETSKEVTMKGYRVKIEYDSLSQNDMDKKRESISQVVIDSLKKSKK